MEAHAIESVRWISTLVVGVVAVGIELRTKRIPNWLTLGATIPVVGAAFVVGVATETLEGWLLAGAVGAWLFSRELLAGGGVKTAALLGATSGLAGGAELARGGAPSRPRP